MDPFDPKNFNEYQALTGRTDNSKLPETQHIAMLVMGLSGETGEVVDTFKKFLFHGHDEPDIDKIEEELGDILWYVARLADMYSLRMGSIAAMNIMKLMERYPDGFSEEASRNRDKSDS
jgi:NTP pyrophosphatase (non-canonical NTP hydrolase)